MSHLDDDVRKYIGFGWTVLPCRHDEKSPLVNWKLYQDKKPTGDDWRRWSQLDIYGLAVLTGKASGFVVVDVDTKDNPLGLDSTVICQTQSGGRHFYYRYQESFRNTVRIANAPIDFRGDGGLVIVPPTQYKGSIYTWIKPPTVEALQSLPDLPKTVSAYLVSKTGINTPRLKLSDVVGIAEGGRDNAINKLAVSQCRLQPQSQWLSDVLPMLRSVNATYNPPLDDAIIVDKFERAMQTVLRTPSTIKKPEVMTIPAAIDDTEAEIDALVADKRPTMPIGCHDFDKKFNFPTGFYIICGHPGSGKGFFALWLARKFFELHKNRTVFYSLEMPKKLVYERILQAWSDLTQAEYLVATREQTEPARKLIRQKAILVYEFAKDDLAQQTPENFETQIQDQYERGYRVFMFDHLHELVGANSNDTNQGISEKWGKKFQQISQKYADCWLIVFVQPNSASGSKNYLTKNDMLGSKSITHKAEVFISLNRAIKKDKDGEILDEFDPAVILYVDKSRVTSSQYFGRPFRFLPTGNFVSEADYNNRPPMSYDEVTAMFKGVSNHD